MALERYWVGHDVQLLGVASGIMLLIGLALIGVGDALLTSLGIIAVILAVIGVLFATAFHIGR